MDARGFEMGGTPINSKTVPFIIDAMNSSSLGVLVSVVTGGASDCCEAEVSVDDELATEVIADSRELVGDGESAATSVALNIGGRLAGMG